MKLSTLLKRFLIIACIAGMPYAAISQDDDTPTTDDPGDPDTPVPIDGGIIWLVAAGVGYGVKKVYDQKKKPLTTKHVIRLIDC